MIVAMPLGPTVRTRVGIMSRMAMIGLNVGRAADFAFSLRPDRAAFLEGMGAQFWAIASKQSWTSRHSSCKSGSGGKEGKNWSLHCEKWTSRCRLLVLVVRLQIYLEACWFVPCYLWCGLGFYLCFRAYQCLHFVLMPFSKSTEHYVDHWLQRCSCVERTWVKLNIDILAAYSHLPWGLSKRFSPTRKRKIFRGGCLGIIFGEPWCLYVNCSSVGFNHTFLFSLCGSEHAWRTNFFLLFVPCFQPQRRFEEGEQGGLCCGSLGHMAAEWVDSPKRFSISQP